MAKKEFYGVKITMKIYVAGPYTGGDIVLNVRNAIEVGNFIFNNGHTPFVPHLFHLWHMVSPRPYKDWMKMDMEWLKKCDALYRLNGPSAGADLEVKKTIELGIPVFTNLTDLLEWMDTNGA